MQLLNNLYKICWKWNNAGIICYRLTSLVSLWVGNVKKSKKSMKIDENQLRSTENFFISSERLEEIQWNFQERCVVR